MHLVSISSAFILVRTRETTIVHGFTEIKTSIYLPLTRLGWNFEAMHCNG